MSFKIDKKATKIARAKQQRGIDLLQAVFGWTPIVGQIIDLHRLKRRNPSRYAQLNAARKRQRQGRKITNTQRQQRKATKRRKARVKS